MPICYLYFQSKKFYQVKIKSKIFSMDTFKQDATRSQDHKTT